MNEQVKPAWKPGTEINSEAQYHEATEQLARELLRDHTPEQLAVIAAQHLIYVDVLKHCKPEAPGFGFRPAKRRVIQITEEEFRKTLESLAARIADGLSAQTTKIVITVLGAYRKHKWGKGGKARHREVTSKRPELLAEWDSQGKHYSGRADFTRIVSQREKLKYTTLYTWITEHDKKKT